jgi:two-component system response regulator FlrC
VQLADSVDLAERMAIMDALRVGNGSRQVAAERLGISPRTLRYKLARLRQAGIEVPAA